MEINYGRHIYVWEDLDFNKRINDIESVFVDALDENEQLVKKEKLPPIAQEMKDYYADFREFVDIT